MSILPKVLKEYPVALIVVVVCINRTTQDRYYRSFIPLTCLGYAKAFDLFNEGSIHVCLKTQQPHLLVAVTHFLIEQKLSLIAMHQGYGSVIQELYAFAKDISL